MARSLALALILALAVLPGCKPSGNDAYAEALSLLGEAERGPCNMEVEASGQALMSVAQIGDCLTKTNEALTKLHEAKLQGVDNREIDELITQTEDEVRRLEAMKRTVLRMQNNLDAKAP